MNCRHCLIQFRHGLVKEEVWKFWFSAFLKADIALQK